MSAPIGIAGAGRMGQALGRLLRERGEPVCAVGSRSVDNAGVAARFVGGGAQATSYGQLPRLALNILIAVPDDAIGDVAGTLAASGMRSGAALHTSGARGGEVLAPLAAAGVACGTLHPLQTVANPAEGVAVLPGSAYAVDGEGAARAWAEQIVGLLDGQILHILAESRALYHAAAVMSSNYLISLIATAVMLMKEAGVAEDAALGALVPLARTSVRNACELGPVAALTGPIVRGDLGTVREHLAALAAMPAAASLYRRAGLATLDIARLRGLGEGPARSIEKLLREGEESA
ncbi:MAG TPA: Rossmann-like and DUF2520 domain-containing protein [Bryobacteraceae bacterium]|nr:Rossmann-like and DUF2520 domain-containing protein [Bryobacteraceae bacterium]